MIRGLYTSALGMITQMQRMDIVANNLANVDTMGYKKDQVAAQSFTDQLMRRLNDPGLRLFNDLPIGKLSQGVFIDDVYTNFANGSLRQTNGTLDLAISGQGFFSVNVGGEELYTRDGTFALLHGMLVATDGGRLQGQNGDITLPNGAISIDESGQIFVDGIYTDALKMSNFSDLHSLRKEKDNYYRRTGDSQAAAFEGKIIQGFLENSNVSSVREMVDMITLSRAYETNARMIAIHDQTMGRAVNEIARR